MRYDIIGDIHGQAEKLKALLTDLGYRDTRGAWRHPDANRMALFVGDFIDRGPHQIESVMIVRRMVEAGSALAVMGNHEFNAIAYHMPDPAREGKFLRSRSGSNGKTNFNQHSAFLAEVDGKPELHKEIMDWFLTLPLWLDLPGVRVVHACWHAGFMNELRPSLNSHNCLSREMMARASDRDSMAFRTVEGLIKGLEIRLPEGHSYLDKDGHKRTKTRTRWWDDSALTYRDLALLPGDEQDNLPATPVIDGAGRADYDNTKLVFFGHYWMTGVPVKQSDTIACVDYSAAKDSEPLVAYRWDGEPSIDNQNFISTEGALPAPARAMQPK